MDIFTKAKRSEIMSKIRSKSGIEILPRYLKGNYLRRHPKGIFGNPDFANKRWKIAVFIDGCFWHKCPKHYRLPKSNKKFWSAKIKRNIVRDKVVNEKLRILRWIVIRIWECELKRNGTRK